MKQRSVPISEIQVLETAVIVENWFLSDSKWHAVFLKSACFLKEGLDAFPDASDRKRFYFEAEWLAVNATCLP